MRRFLATATLILFALRALIPAGVMPDLQAIGAGHLEFVICTGHGEAPMPLDPAGGSPLKSPGADCPFGTTLAKS